MKIKYIQASQAWYSKAALEGRDCYDEFMFSVYNDDGSLMGEFGFEFRKLPGNRDTVCMRCYEDAMEAMTRCLDIVHSLADGQGWTPKAFRRLLKGLPHYVDATPTFESKGDDEKMEMAKERLVPMVSSLADEINWSEISLPEAPVGLFVKGGEMFLIAMGAGLPDTNWDKVYGARLYGSSAISNEVSHDETADMLLFDATRNGFFAALDQRTASV